MKNLSGKTAIVTGAASGIGLGIATALAEAGANVVMADIQKDAVERAAHGLSGTNNRVMPVRIDVTQEQSVIDALAEAERNFGKLHIACNNADSGRSPQRPPMARSRRERKFDFNRKASISTICQSPNEPKHNNVWGINFSCSLF